MRYRHLNQSGVSLSESLAAAQFSLNITTAMGKMFFNVVRLSLKSLVLIFLVLEYFIMNCESLL